MNNALHFIEVKQKDGTSMIVNINHIVAFNEKRLYTSEMRGHECYTLAPGQFDYLCHMLGRVVAIMRLPNESDVNGREG